MLKIVQLLVLVCAVSAQILPPQILPPTGIRRVRPGPIIQTNIGFIQGQEETYDIFRRIHTFKGIRYARAPVGDLRFRAPVPVERHTQVFRAFQEGSECPQMSLLLNRFSGEEDCLFLNIAAPTNIRSRLPVVVSIHGGGLHFGSGSIERFGPELLNQDGVIFVSMNYRLNVLGFLNVGDANSPGNFGLKDIIEALRWVQSNIEFFGGDPDNVSIWGISGGSLAVHSLVLSPAARGLFHKAISHSGSLFSTWAFSRNPVAEAQMLARNLQLDVGNTTDLVNQLRQVSVQRLLENSELEIRARPSPVLFGELPFMPSVDPADTQEILIFPAPPETLARTGEISQVPYLVGFNYRESAVNALPTEFERFNQNPNLLIPPEWNIVPNSQQAQEVIAIFRQLYFSGAQNLTAANMLSWMDYASDREFIFGISKQARLHRSRMPLYYFRFTYGGSLSFTQRLTGLSDIYGAVHGDDLFYIFRMNFAITPVAPGDEAFRIQQRQVRLWTNFIKYSNPTPTTRDPLIDATWPLMTESVDFMDIDRNLQPGMSPFAQRMNIWHMLDERFLRV